jgi:hypothetical protein
MTSVSTIYSMGTLLSRAEESGTCVRVLVEGQWISGIPVSCDGHGAILEGDGGSQFLVRVQAISAISYAPPEGPTIPQPRAAYESSYAY